MAKNSRLCYQYLASVGCLGIKYPQCSPLAPFCIPLVMVYAPESNSLFYSSALRITYVPQYYVGKVKGFLRHNIKESHSFHQVEFKICSHSLNL